MIISLILHCRCAVVMDMRLKKNDKYMGIIHKWYRGKRIMRNQGYIFCTLSTFVLLEAADMVKGSYLG